jgi:hypothetical protein
MAPCGDRVRARPGCAPPRPPPGRADGRGGTGSRDAGPPRGDRVALAGRCRTVGGVQRLHPQPGRLPRGPLSLSGAGRGYRWHRRSPSTSVAGPQVPGSGQAGHDRAPSHIAHVGAGAARRPVHLHPSQGSGGDHGSPRPPSGAAVGCDGVRLPPPPGGRAARRHARTWELERGPGGVRRHGARRRQASRRHRAHERRGGSYRGAGRRGDGCGPRQRRGDRDQVGALHRRPRDHAPGVGGPGVAGSGVRPRPWGTSVTAAALPSSCTASTRCRSFPAWTASSR